MSDPCLCLSLRQASRKLTARYDAALQPAGISLAQFSLLRDIGRHGPASVGGLADLVELDRSTLGRNARVLKRMGLVAIRPGADLRQATLSLSAAGEAVLGVAVPLWAGAQDELQRTLGAAGMAQFEAVLAVLEG